MEEILALLNKLDATCKESPDKGRTLAFKCLDVAKSGPSQHRDLLQAISTHLFNTSTYFYCYNAQCKEKKE